MLTLAVFKNADARNLITGQALSQICDKMMTLGLVWMIANQYSAIWIPWFLALSALPHLLLAWSAGGLASRFSPIKTVIWADIARALIFVGSAWAWPYLSIHSGLVALFLITAIANVASALFNPAILSLPSSLRHRELLPQLTASIDSCFTMASVLGPIISVVLYPFVGLRGLFLINGLSYGLAAVLESTIQIAPSPVPPLVDERAATQAPEPSSNSPMAVLQSDSFIAWVLIAFFLMNLVLSPMLAFLPLFANQVFRGGIGTLAWLETSLGVGTVIGSVALSVMRIQIPAGLRVVTSIAVIALMYVGFSLCKSPALSCLLLGILGLALSVVNISMITLFQTRPKADHVPVVMSLVNMISVGAVPLSMTLLGGLIAHVELRQLAFSLSLVLSVLAIATLFYRELRMAT